VLFNEPQNHEQYPRTIFSYFILTSHVVL